MAERLERGGEVVPTCSGLAGFVLGRPEFKSLVPLFSTFEVNQLGFLFSLQWSHIHQPCSRLRDRRVGETEKARTKREEGTGYGNTVRFCPEVETTMFP